MTTTKCDQAKKQTDALRLVRKYNPQLGQRTLARYVYTRGYELFSPQTPQDVVDRAAGFIGDSVPEATIYNRIRRIDKEVPQFNPGDKVYITRPKAGEDRALKYSYGPGFINMYVGSDEGRTLAVRQQSSYGVLTDEPGWRRYPPQVLQLIEPAKAS